MHGETEGITRILRRDRTQWHDFSLAGSKYGSAGTNMGAKRVKLGYWEPWGMRKGRGVL